MPSVYRVPKACAYLGLTIGIFISLIGVNSVSASAAGVGGYGSGWVACATTPDGYDWQGSVSDSVTFNWTIAEYAYDRYGNPYATYLRPYEGAIFIPDPNRAMWDACSPFLQTNEVYFDNGTQTATINFSGGCYWNVTYDTRNNDRYTLCNSNYYIGPRYNSTYHWGNVSWGISLFPEYGSGAINGRTPYKSL